MNVNSLLCVYIFDFSWEIPVINGVGIFKSGDIYASIAKGNLILMIGVIMAIGLNRPYLILFFCVIVVRFVVSYQDCSFGSAGTTWQPDFE